MKEMEIKLNSWTVDVKKGERFCIPWKPEGLTVRGRVLSCGCVILRFQLSWSFAYEEMLGARRPLLILLPMRLLSAY